MVKAFDIARAGALIDQPARAEMLRLLSDGRGRTATEIAVETGISRPTASRLLNHVIEAGLVRVDRQGRHRYYRLAGPQVADLLKTLRTVPGHSNPSNTRFGPRDNAMRRARMCYDHLAGELGYGITESLVQRGALVEDGDNFQLTERGERIFADLAIDVAAARRRHRHFARTCLDWSERRPHLAGALGAALAERLFDLGWISRESDARTVHTTPTGHRELQLAFDVEIPAMPWASCAGV